MATILFDGLAYGALLFLIGVGLSVTMGLMNFVNLAHGSFAMVGGYVAAVAMNDHGVPFLLALVLAMAAGALAGGLAEILLIRHLYRAHPLDQVLLSIGLVFVSIAVATYIFGPTMLPFSPPGWLDGRFGFAGLELSRYRLFLILVGAALFVGLLLFLDRTRYGAMIRAAVDNQRVAQATGIDVRRLFFLTFTFGCALAGLGGALSLGMLSLNPVFPLHYMVYFLIVVSVGGAGTITGPLLAAIILGVGDLAGKYYLPEAGGFLIYLLMLAILLIRPNGLIAKRGSA